MKYCIKQGILAVSACSLLAFMSGCTTKTGYGDSTSAQAVSTDFGSSDLQQIAEKMVDSLLTFPPVVELTTARRPVITVDRVKNKTMQHIDTESLTDSIRSKLVRSGKFRFIDRSTDTASIEEIKIQQESGLVNRDTAVDFGQQIGAEFILTANLTEIKQSAGRTTDVYYKFTMNLKNLRTGILEWSDEKEIRKIKTKPVLGF